MSPSKPNFTLSNFTGTHALIALVWILYFLVVLVTLLTHQPKDLAEEILDGGAVGTALVTWRLIQFKIGSED